MQDKKREKRRRFSLIQHKQQKDNIVYEWHLRSIDETMANLDSVQDLKNHLGWTFSYGHEYEGNNLLLCLDDNFAEKKFHDGFTDTMEVYLHMEKEVIRSCCKFSRKELLPPLNVNPEQSNSFLFLPLHVRDNILGYAVFINKPDIVYDTNNLYMWARHISQDLERVHQNIRMKELNLLLTEISMTDALTGLRNRAGYDSLAYPYLRQCQKEGKLSAMIFADVNHMKLINDKYGHLQGDNALRTVAEAIRQTMPKDWIAVRFGGDEFIMAGECKSKKQADESMYAMKHKVHENEE